MGMAGTRILIANPGSASRKYALYDGQQERAQLHFEWGQNKVLCTLNHDGNAQVVPVEVADLTDAASHVMTILQTAGLLPASEQISKIGLRVVAPGAYFLQDHVVDDDFAAALKAAQPRAPLHVAATLEELQTLRQEFPATPIIGVSDSVFHVTKPDYAWNYGIPLADADRLDVKRFGYHGLSVASVVHTLKKAQKLPAKLVVCHLGSGASVTAVHGGKSLDTTMGYSPLDGIIMATRSGSIDPTAVNVLKTELKLDDAQMETYLNTQSGLLGLGGSSDLRELVARADAGDHYADLAINTYVFAIQKAIGQMAAALGGLDVLVFTGTVGERSAPVRHRVMQRLHYLDLLIDEHANQTCDGSAQLTNIARLANSKPVFVTATDESAEMSRRTQEFDSPVGP